MSVNKITMMEAVSQHEGTCLSTSEALDSFTGTTKPKGLGLVNGYTKVRVYNGILLKS